ncbi:mechanosensitive ion channel domain-containing protein [Aurantiacibacter odishensis]|uniref:mechanosensitive ion channel domain-containing protein n=1 Tax=Aurantiacibacter odishensis TaxID=1155476 RepID=UPI000E7081B0|nr:mechanosensitive ion channel domain-containing protein [Aurantiacibacter odishensis]
MRAAKVYKWRAVKQFTFFEEPHGGVRQRIFDGEQMNFEIPSALYTSDVFASVSLILVLLGARLIAGRALRRREDLTQQVARRWTANFRNVLILIAAIGLIMIWAPQLRTFALSLTAVAVAIVVATKELILCLSGAALRTFTRAFSVGDVIEVGTTKGEVLDLNLLATRLKEFESTDGSIVPTGRTITLPYSLLFTLPAKVLPHAKGTIEHAFEMTFEPDADIFAMNEELLETAEMALADRVGDTESTTSSGNERARCRINFGTSEIGKYRLEIILIGHLPDPQGAENAVARAIGSLVHSRQRITVGA